MANIFVLQCQVCISLGLDARAVCMCFLLATPTGIGHAHQKVVHPPKSIMANIFVLQCQVCISLGLDAKAVCRRFSLATPTGVGNAHRNIAYVLTSVDRIPIKMCGMWG